jgi:hypothetical protein
VSFDMVGKQPADKDRTVPWIDLARDLGEVANTWSRVLLRIGLLVWLPFGGQDMVALATTLLGG